jgi:two-component system sensor histidine kinase CreC
MVNTLASFAAENTIGDEIDVAKIKTVFSNLRQRRLNAKIYEVTKTSVDTQVYITNNTGTVIFDSGTPENQGEDFSRWRNIRLTLKGEYGARATRIEKDDPATLVMHVSAPIIRDGKRLGIITVYKPINFIKRFINLAEKRIMINATLAFIVLVLLGIVVSTWLTYPITKLKRYVDDVRNGKKVSIPSVGTGEIGELATSFAEMREALEGKKYVEEYVRNLTHELKSPIAATQGALELLDEKETPEEQRKKFLKNLRHENSRMRLIVDKMLLLSQLENVNTIFEKNSVNIPDLFQEIVKSVKLRAENREIVFNAPTSPLILNGDANLLYDAFENVLNNAVDFTKPDGKIPIEMELSDTSVTITISDDGTGIPDYATGKIFDKFYSLPRPGEKGKSSGLGLSITREVIELHGGSITISNKKDGNGTQVTIILPIST